jgi:prepilin-type N-terminal cleavage/methylation domain-containing protein
MLTRLRQEDGFTLPELLITLVIGLTVTMAGLTLVEVTMNRSGEISARIEAVQNGRSAMDTITRQLRSQVCLLRPGGTVDDPRRSLTAANGSSVTFYADMRNTENPAPGAPTPTPGGFSGPEKHQLTFIAGPAKPGAPVDAPPAGKIVETVWKPTGVVNGIYQYPATSTTRELITTVEQAPVSDDDGNPILDGSGKRTYIPIFQYFRFDFTQDPPQPSAQLAGTLADGQLKQVARIKITYKAQPARKRANDRASTVFTNEVFVRTVDPNAEASDLSNPCL